MQTIKYLVIILLSSAVTTVQAQLYPEPLGSFENFSNMTGLYERIYTDINPTDEAIIEAREAVILERVKEHTIVQERNLSDEDIQTLCQLRVPEIALETDFSRKTFKDLATELERLCEMESATWEEENNLQRRLVLQTLFQNQTSRQAKDSPFDVLEDLNVIDGIWLGEKSGESDPNFLIFQNRETEADFQLEPEDWQDQTELEIDPEYASDDTSLAGILWNLQEPLKDLNQHSLVAECNTMQFFQPASFDNFLPVNTGDLLPIGMAVPMNSGDTPEVISILTEQKTTDFTALENDIINQLNCVELLSGGEKSSRRGVIEQASEKCEVQLRTLDNRLRYFSTKLDYTDLVSRYERLSPEWGRWQAEAGKLGSFIGRWRDILEDFVTRTPKKQ
jgi:hypothetical protein